MRAKIKTSLLQLRRNGNAAHHNTRDVARNLVPGRFDIAPCWHAGLGVRPLVIVLKANDELSERGSKVVVRAREERLDLAERLKTRVRERELFVFLLMIR